MGKEHPGTEFCIPKLFYGGFIISLFIEYYAFGADWWMIDSTNLIDSPYRMIDSPYQC